LSYASTENGATKPRVNPEAAGHNLPRYNPRTSPYRPHSHKGWRVARRKASTSRWSVSGEHPARVPASEWGVEYDAVAFVSDLPTVLKRVD